ncbi:UNVERIFIED_CONTAM: Serum amyloid A protein [Trichonephila clavipes]
MTSSVSIFCLITCLLLVNSPVCHLWDCDFVKEAAQGAADMWDAYTDMREANYIGADKYFHARGNYEAAERGPGGKWAAEVIRLSFKYPAYNASPRIHIMTEPATYMVSKPSDMLIDKIDHLCREAVTSLCRYLRYSTHPPVSRWIGERTRYLLWQTDVREAFQGSDTADSKADQAANEWGRNGGDPNKYRPEGLPDKY